MKLEVARGARSVAFSKIVLEEKESVSRKSQKG